MKTWQCSFCALVALFMLLLVLHPLAGVGDERTERQAAAKLQHDGNWREAYTRYARLATDPASDQSAVADDFDAAIVDLQRLDRVNEIDTLRERAIAAQPHNWRLLLTAARSLVHGDSSGFLIAGKFYRGNHRGGGRYVNAGERDRARALQLLAQALPLLAAEPKKTEVGDCYFSLAYSLNDNRAAWRLQELTDLTTLPDYQEGYWNQQNGADLQGAPVTADGSPVYYALPADWASAKNDGERCRWALAQMVAADPTRADAAKMLIADFLYRQFGEGTLTAGGNEFNLRDGEDTQAGAYALATLSDNETLARLANGVHRFTMPPAQNYITLYQQVADGAAPEKSMAQRALARIFENRRQYDRAAKYWQLAGDDEHVRQILGNWGSFSPVATQPADPATVPKVDFIFRNGAQIICTADRIDVSTLLGDVKTYLSSKPKQLKEDLNIQNLGERMVAGNLDKYLAGRAATWSQSLAPRPKHFDRRITLDVPLHDAGAYLLTAKMKNGNTSRVILWLADTVIVKKPLDKQTYLYLADAVSGEGIAAADLTFFGYQQRWVNMRDGSQHYDITTHVFTRRTDDDGQLILDGRQDFNDYSWIITSRKDHRLAFLGYTNLWDGSRSDVTYNAVKCYAITDRPAYRPGQVVKYKFWVNRAQYDKDGPSQFAGKFIVVSIRNPRGEMVDSAALTVDNYGGVNGEFTLPADAMLGQYFAGIENYNAEVTFSAQTSIKPEKQYSANLDNMEGIRGVSFRVEEYKKPEFAVQIAAPEKPVMLGEQVNAKISARYYFGAPVTNAKVSYKITRSAQDAAWYPPAEWDWCYGPGYWWFAPDYAWYPGWSGWGCPRPALWQGDNDDDDAQPEVVAQGVSTIGADGTMTVNIDTALALALYGQQDQRYDISADVTDASRRTISGQGSVLVASKPFSVYAWVDKGYYQKGDVIQADFNARTLDNRPVTGKGALRLLRVRYPRGPKTVTPEETEVQHWALDTDADGKAHVQVNADEPGQYRLSYTVTDADGHAVEGGYLVNVHGTAAGAKGFRFNDLELITDKREYQPGDKVNLLVNTNRLTSTVLLFLRPVDGIYLPPKVLHIDSQCVNQLIDVVKRDMPNFFVEAVTVGDGQVYSEMREIIVPPEQRVLHVSVSASAAQFKPGAPATVTVKVTDTAGQPYQGALAVTMYDKALEYISGGSNVGDIKSCYWNWRREHSPQGENSLRSENPFLLAHDEFMATLGDFGIVMSAQDNAGYGTAASGVNASTATPVIMYTATMGGRQAQLATTNGIIVPMVSPRPSPFLDAGDKADHAGGADIAPTVRANFADAAFWSGSLTTDAKGLATVTIPMPENLTTWKTRVWAMGAGTRVGEGSIELLTTKKLIVQLEAPRFFTQKDEVVLSAVVHNYLATAKQAKVILELQGGCLAPMNATGAAATYSLPPLTVNVPANGEQRVDWRVQARQPGQATVRMKALTDEESDAMQQTFPVNVHGMLKMDSFSGVIRPDKQQATLTLSVPAARLPAQSRLEIRYSPTLAGAMLDALPYLIEYPYGCTEQTLDSFLPLVITQQVLAKTGVNLADIRNKRTNLNAQEIGDDQVRAAQWQRAHEAVYDAGEVASMAQYSVNRLASMQCADGGWGWFSGDGECSYPHTTALVVHGLQLAQANGVAVDDGMLQRGVQWLQNYQQESVRELQNAPAKTEPYKLSADALDAFVFMALTDAGLNHAATTGRARRIAVGDSLQNQNAMRDFLYRDRLTLPVYAMSMYGLALNTLGETAKRDMLVRNLDQYLRQDEENQTAWLKLPADGWWYWYGSEYEAQAYYLKLLTVVDPQGEKAARLVKYLLNNRKNATYWNSTRDTAIVLESFADFLKASGEDAPDMTVDVQLDGKTLKTVAINKANLFSFDNTLQLSGAALTAGAHTVTLLRHGAGSLYFNAYLSNFTLEDPIGQAGLEVKVTRKYYKLVKTEQTVTAPGTLGQVLSQQVDKYTRMPLETLAQVKSGDLVEVELQIDAKNDYEYILLEDPKAAGFEPVEVQSGYNGNEMDAYLELRDDHVSFFIRALARGSHSISYRLRAETPGAFSALPTVIQALYAPELRGNADEMKLGITD